MYICLCCHRKFDEPKNYVEIHGMDTPPYEKFSGCPFCGGAYADIKYFDEKEDEDDRVD